VSLDSYSVDRGDDFYSCGGKVISHETTDLAGRLLLIEAVISFGMDNEGILEVTEVVELDASGRPHRRRYRYHFSYRDLFLFRYCRDFKRHPELPEHKHVGLADHRIDSGPIRFSEVVSEIYDVIADIAASAMP